MTLALSLMTSSMRSQETTTVEMIGRSEPTLSDGRLTAEALWAMGRIGSIATSQNGKIAYTVTYYSVEQNKSHSVLYIMNTDGTDQRRLTVSSDNETDPAFSPDGTRLFFLSNQSGSNQVWTMGTDGNNRRQVSFCSSDVNGFKLSPDGTHLILVREVETYASIEKNDDDLPLATGMVIDDLNYRHWDKYVKSIPHIFLSEIKDGKADDGIDLLHGEPYECPSLPFGGTEEFNWSPDGRYIYYTCRKKTGLNYAVSTDTDIFCYDTQTQTTVNLCKPADFTEPKSDPSRSMAQQTINSLTRDCNVGYDLCPAASPDGKYLAWLSMERAGYESDRARLCVLNLETNEKTYVTESFRSSVNGFCWDTDSKTLYFTGVWNARASVYSTNLKGEVKPVATGDYDYGSSLLLSNKSLILTRQSMSAPDDIFRISLNKGYEVTQLTEENKHIMDKLTMGEVKERMVPTTDGKEELCWVIYPPYFNTSKKYPTLLFCEGGPQNPVSQFWSYRWNFQIMAANGYIVIAPNRRGLPGFGMEWLEEISGDYPGQCMQDYLSAIDDICKESYVDTARLGCVGASFGGYSVYYLAGHHDKRFKCFIAHDGIFNTQAQYYETEEMWFPNWDMGAAPWRKGVSADPNNAERVEDNQPRNAYSESPHLFVDKWDTPILCIHGEKDYRVLSSQGQSAFAAAVLRGIPAQLLLYPDENHWVLNPQNAILWQRTFFRWLDRWLK